MEILIGRAPTDRCENRLGRGKIRKGVWRVGAAGSGFYTHWASLDDWLAGGGSEFLRTVIFEAMSDAQLKALGLEVESEPVAQSVDDIRVGSRIRILRDGLDNADVSVGDVLEVTYLSGEAFGADGWGFSTIDLGSGFELVTPPPDPDPEDSSDFNHEAWFRGLSPGDPFLYANREGALTYGDIYTVNGHRGPLHVRVVEENSMQIHIKNVWPPGYNLERVPR